MSNGKIRIIAAKELETDILSVEELPATRDGADFYVENLRRLVRGKQATFAGRAIDEDSGVAYQIFRLPKSDTQEKGATIFIEDRPATKLLSTLVDDEGNVRRCRIRK
jgi:hypothetical protein